MTDDPSRPNVLPEQLPSPPEELEIAQLPEIELTGLSATGLPFPVSTDPANQGANAIKALALALDPRAPYQVESGQQTVAVASTGASAGIAIVPFAKAFKTAPKITAIATALYSGSAGATFVPTLGLLETTTTQARFFLLAIPWQTTAGPIAPWGGNVTLNYFAAAPA